MDPAAVPAPRPPAPDVLPEEPAAATEPDGNPKNLPPPPNQAVIEMLAMAPNFATLKPMVLALTKNFSLAPKASREMWLKTAYERVLLFISEAEDLQQIRDYINWTAASDEWPNYKKMKLKLRVAAERRQAELFRRIPKSP
jgi:hypothetical protein